MPGTTPTEFVLDEGGEAVLETVMELSPRWQELAHAGERTRAVLLVPGERLISPWLQAEAESQASLLLGRGLPEISADGLTAELWLRTDADEPRRLLSWTLDNHAPGIGEAALEVSLPLREGQAFQLELRCGPGPEGMPDADWLAVMEWVVGRFDRMPLLRARSHAAWRLVNELAHFNGAYDAAFFADRRTAADVACADGAPLRTLPENAAGLPLPDLSGWDERLRDVHPLPGENAFSYAHRLLRQLLPEPAPNFVARLRTLQARSPGQPLRMLSLCAGNAAVERSLLERAGVPVQLCLVDVNASLLERAASGMPAGVGVDRVLGSVDRIGPTLGEFDVVNITSGLHHIVELERVLAGIAATLAPGGEFWLIGEQVGRNGNRLWPEAGDAANAIFAAWPEEKRRNAGTGRVDARLPALDYSRACFEGIRSQDIEILLGRYFLPVDVHVRDCFLWRLVDPAYAGNFDLADPADLALIRAAARAEARHWLEGGRGTSVNGVWRSKRDLLRAPPLPNP
ncbi:MAG TPA: class I SAM-dependent methyltransferase [Arenimonas sp.]